MILLFGAVGLAFEPKGMQAASVQPQLLTLAMETPDMLVSVIAQKADKTDTAEKLVASLGGLITKDLHIINAFAAELTAQAAVALSQSNAVRWVSLDAPVRRSATFNDTVADFFNQRSYANNDGTQPWAGNWVEIGDDNKPDKGKVKIDKNQLRMESQNRGIQRSLDLTNATAAVLSFEVRRESMDRVLEYVSLGVSTDGGATWQELTRFAGPANDPALTPVSFDLAAFLPAEVTLRFMTSPDNGGKLWVDNLVVDYLWDDGVEEPPPTPEPPPQELPPLPPPDFPFTQDVYDNLYAPLILDYRHNSGSRNWSSPWTEIGEDDGPDAGNVRFADVDYWTRITIRELSYDGDGWNLTHGIWRSTDLSTATTAVLSIVYKRASLEGEDYVALEISSDGGATWFEIERFGAGNDDVFQSISYNISPFISDSVVIRFVSNYLPGDSADYFYFDEPRIRFDPEPLPAPVNTFLDTLGVPALRDMDIKGHGVVVAVIDSGMSPDWDFQRLPNEPGITSSRLHNQVSFNDNTNLAFDINGHGTHIAGIIGGSGQKSDGFYTGIATNVGYISLKVSDDYGAASESDVVSALQWVYDNNIIGEPYTIKVVNLSLNSTVEQSYHNSPINAAVEILWFNGVVVVASAGNTSAELGYNPINAAPANDPFIITVGASDENRTGDRSDDFIAPFSAYGTTLDGFVKPDIIAPGKDIVATLAVTSWWRNYMLDRYVDGIYFRASGTSMSAPMVTGAVALLLQDEPNLTPDQVKYRLLNTASLLPGRNGDPHQYPYLDIYGAVMGNTTESDNTGLTASQLLWTGDNPVAWDSVAWNSVAWNSVAWNSVAWNSVAWNSVAWNSVAWNE
jgi:serine protease AprX